MKHGKKCNFIVILVLSGILLFEMVFYYLNHTIPTFSVRSTTESEIKDELIIALFMDNIIADSSNFYDNYFPDSYPIEYFNYEFKIKDIKKEGEPVNVYITFETTPVIGPHIPIGDDEIIYKVDALGNKILVNFIHKKSYEIPERLKPNMIKSYPETK
ncbi:DUF3888 domain-containing protein [Anaerocolumna chitinilytica]|uniref:DUF3888 domain-containing protein n=1 Tax=Anaerocolumna chitinilytica TaxID=1727145 RepID=A0A7I8DN42_9FIRM|nr:DUF3888 domain-containing protein [Anaerocolumna chitinilytica]BCJ98711.1 hypothetical protein bsdcttw_17520 [Anaerocolumna chitinilytica]